MTDLIAAIRACRTLADLDAVQDRTIADIAAERRPLLTSAEQTAFMEARAALAKR